MHNYWKNIGQKKSQLFRKTSVSFSEEEGKELFGTSLYNPDDGHTKPHRYPRRGAFMCNHNLKHDKCPFQVSFSWYSQFKHYKIVPSTKLTHNHELSNINISLDGCEFINNEADLSAEEINSMQLMAITNYSIAKVKETMAFKTGAREMSRGPFAPN